VANRTQQVETEKHTKFSYLNIQNRNPAYDYSFQRRREIEDAGGQHPLGWEPITAGNEDGESLASLPFTEKTRGTGNMIYHDTIACRRKKEVSRFLKTEEDERYNAQIAHVRSASKRAREALRELDSEATVLDKSRFSGPGMTQRKGPTEA